MITPQKFKIPVFFYFALALLFSATYLIFSKTKIGNRQTSENTSYKFVAGSKKDEEVAQKHSNHKRARVKSTEEQKGATIFNEKKMPVAFTTSSGTLTSTAINDYEISKEDIPVLESIISSHFKEIETHLSNNTIYMESDSDSKNRIFTYRIQSLGNERHSILNSLKLDLICRFKKTKGEAIFSALMNDPGNQEKLAGLGQYDAEIKFHPNERGDSEIVTFVYTDPASGKRICTSSRTIESFKEVFGDTFVFSRDDSK